MKRTKNKVRNPKIKMRLRARLLRCNDYAEFVATTVKLVSSSLGVPSKLLAKDFR